MQSPGSKETGGSVGPGLLLPENPWDLSKVLTWLEADSWGRRCPSHALDRGWTPRHLPCMAAPLALWENFPPMLPTMLYGVFHSLPTFRPMITSSHSFLGAGKRAV